MTAILEAPTRLYTPDGEHLTCPGCEKPHALWRYKRPFVRNPKYQEQTAEIVKCPGCGWTFAPLPVAPC